ncbi:MAG: NUDIX domain-containing protein [Treponema sp.]|nr:NUDIX domain-containing protein [Treponema sp.]
MFNFCPSCASKKIKFEEGKVFRCPDCGFVYYHNIAAATGCIISVPQTDGAQRLVFLVRGKEPAVGKLDLPGGFVDVGEGALVGLYRELQEEIGWTPPVPDGAPLASVFTLFASFSNVYEYKNIKYNTCDMYFSVTAPGLKPEDLRLEQAEVSAVRFLKPEEIDFSQFAFESTRRAVKAYLNILD